jgi:PTH1 family peptidyl-tRNA hydrolase
LIVVHDDVDLPIGKIKIIKERGSAGHKGVESIIKNIGNDGLIRFRIGIAGKTLRQAQGEKIKAMKVVLKNFSKNEQNIIDETIQRTTDALNLFVKEGLENTQSKYN